MDTRWLRSVLTARTPRGTRLHFKTDDDAAQQYGLPSLYVYVHERLSGNVLDEAVPCMSLYFMKVTPRHKFDVYLTGLRYGKAQAACTLSGETLLRWVLRLRPDVVRVVHLTDASRKTIAAASVQLTPFRKFLTGVGWYEQFGLLPNDPLDNYKFQETYRRVRRLPMDALRALVFHAFRPRIPDDLSAGNVDLGPHRGYRRSAWRDRLTSLVRRHAVVPTGAVLGSMAELERPPDATLFDWLHFVRRFGVDATDEMLALTSHERKWLRRWVPKDRQESMGRACALATLAPSGMRKVLARVAEEDADAAKDARRYVQMLASVLTLLESMGLLYTPTELQCPTSYTTPRALSSGGRRCDATSVR